MKRIIILTIFIMVNFYALSAQSVQTTASEAAQFYSQSEVIKEKAPKPRYWTNSLLTNINFLQTSYVNWAKGGNNNVALDVYVLANANYKRDEIFWNNKLQLDYGILYSEDKPILQKVKDRIMFESTWGKKITETLSSSAKFIFLNQFAKGYTYKAPSKADPTKKDWEDARILKSSIFSPADITLGLGAEWVPNAWLKMNFAPLTGGLKIVREESLRKGFGMERKKEFMDLEKYPKDLGTYYKSTRFQFGAMLTTDANLQINDNFTMSTQLILFSNYLLNPQNIRVNWVNRFMWKLAKFFSLNFQTDIIYDDTILVKTEEYPEGAKMLQFMESFKFGFTYSFSSKK